MPTTPPNVFDLFASLISSPKFIAALFGMISGTVATFIAPWTKWHFKEKELQRESRKEKITYWREQLNSFPSNHSIYQSPLYQELRNLIPNDELKRLHNDNSIHVTIDDGAVSTTESRIILRLHQAISDKEKDWKLI